MTATSVASSSQMFSAATFGQPSQSQTPPSNPFDAGGGTGGLSQGKRNKRASPFSDQSGNEGNRTKDNPFLKNLNGSDGAKQNGKKADDRKKKVPDVKKGRVNGGDHSKKPAAQNARSNGLNPFAGAGARPTSSSSADSNDVHVPEAQQSNDPHARKVYEQLRKDNIHPPPWPSQPGNPKNKAEVTKFREKYEAYRSKVRASLTKAGLIDDPSKRKTLQDAIDFKGICEDMCPEYEKITRINEMDVHQPEKNSRTTFPDTRRMVKKLARSAAGQEAPLPMDVRSISSLRRTLDYLIDDLLKDDTNLPGLHGFLWDRTRAIRRDFTFFSSLTPDEKKTQVYVLENIARFHVTALHLLTQDGNAPEDFVEQQELEQLGKALLSLRDLYDDCNEQNIKCENEPEFRAYYLVFHALDPNIIETLQRQWKPNLWRDSDEVRTAVSLVEALQSTFQFHGPLKDAPSLAASAAFHTYFRIVEDPKVSYTMACFAECHFPQLRRSILATFKKAFSRPRDTPKDVTAAMLNKYLRFDTIEQAIQFAELHDFEFGQCEEDPSNISRQYLMLDNRKHLPHLRLQHQFSQSVVEKKRGSRSLPELIHRTVYEDENAPPSEESLFVSDAEKPTPTPNPFSSFGTPSILGSNSASNSSLGTTPNGPLSTTPGPFQQKPLPGTFAPTTSTESNPINPFAPQPPSNKSQPPSIFLNPPTPTLTDAKPQNQFGTSSGTSINPFGAPSSTPFATGIAQAKTPFAQLGTTALAKPQETKPTDSSSFDPGPIVNVIQFDRPSEAKPLGLQTTPSLQQELPKAPESNSIPPIPNIPSAIPPKFPSFPPVNTTPASSISTQPTPGLSLGGSTLAPSKQKEKNDAIATATAPSTFVSKPVAQLPVTAQDPPKTDSILGLPRPSTPSLPTTVTKPASPPPPAPPVAPPAPPRDLMGDFTKWFVLGDGGIWEDFRAFILEDILQTVYTTFQNEQERKRQQEEEERAITEATEFRVYHLSVKYFYRWRDNARELRLKELRRNGRDQVRAFYEAQRVAQLKAEKEAARRAAREEAELAQLNRPEEFKELLKHQASKRESNETLPSSRTSPGVSREEAAASQILNRPPSSVNGSVTSNQSSSSRFSTSKGGSKTQALRKQLLGDQPTGFRRSLPPLSSRDGSRSDTESHVSRVSERWRLKAMGIVQMPDGTALPESLANDSRYAKKRHSGIGSMGPPASPVVRRASISGLANPSGHTLANRRAHATPTKADVIAAKNKRKRVTEDDHEQGGETDSKVHKRVMSDAQILINELKAMREEMEEGATWFRDQNERLQSELMSRGSTPWDDGT
ncbi:SAC3/GANP/Nin1/mts3/eIF-3 p25 family-domain-containing protein [Mariannaea sp. PMI_226]|nr:SAC3/GANP/Nin1/mts3/eIF-3 p25 family-domain-containing protein [Mariannaea sp. PMI_226]